MGQESNCFAKEDKLLPVITITIYWNFGAWDAPRCLHEMLDVKQAKILEYVPDYKMNLIVPEEITDFDKFQTELGTVLEFVQCADDREEIRSLLEANRVNGLYMSREATELLNSCVNAGLKLPEQGEEETDMCRGIEGLVEEGREEGREEGKQRLLIEQVCKKLRKNKSLAQIAEELEEDEAVIAELCELATSCAPEYYANEVFTVWKEKQRL